MNGRVHAAVLLLALTIATKASIGAQRRGLEINVGAVSATLIDYTLADRTLSESRLAAGGEEIGVGLFLSPAIAIEPSVLVGYTHVAGVSQSGAQLRLAMPFFLRRSWGHTGPFIAPDAGITIGALTGAASQSQFSFGLGLGDRIRLAAPVSLSVEGLVHRALRVDLGAGAVLNSYVSLAATVGLSVFLR